MHTLTVYIAHVKSFETGLKKIHRAIYNSQPA